MHAETMLLIDHRKSQCAESNFLLKQSMSTNENVDSAIRSRTYDFLDRKSVV